MLIVLPHDMARDYFFDPILFAFEPRTLIYNIPFRRIDKSRHRFFDLRISFEKI